MRIKYILMLLIVLIASGCKQDECSQSEHKDGYSCVVRIELKWDKNLSRHQRDNILRRFADDALYQSRGRDFVALVLNNNDEIMHIDYTNDIKCKQKYQNTKRILDTYLKPLENAPKYKIKKALPKEEFKNLEVQLKCNTM